MRDVDTGGELEATVGKAKEPTERKGSLRKRLISGFLGMGFFLTLCFWGALPYSLGVTFVVALGLFEFLGAFSRAEKERAEFRLNPRWLNPALACTALLLPLAAYLYSRSPIFAKVSATAWVGLLVALFAILTARSLQTGLALEGIRKHYGLLGCLYIGGLFSSFVLLRSLTGQEVKPPFGFSDGGAWLMLLPTVCVWTADTMAMAVGKAIGRTPLAPIISPGKTVEGAVGGFLFSVLVGMGFAFWIGVGWQHGIAIGAIAGIAGVIGDLFESSLKREVGVKDFGRLIPGHGGLLDRADSLLFVIPLAYLYLRLVNV